MYNESKLIAIRLNIKQPTINNYEKRTKKLLNHLEKYLVEGNLEYTMFDSEPDFKIIIYLPITYESNKCWTQ